MIVTCQVMIQTETSRIQNKMGVQYVNQYQQGTNGDRRNSCYT